MKRPDMPARTRAERPSKACEPCCPVRAFAPLTPWWTALRSGQLPGLRALCHILGVWLYEFPVAAVTNFHRLGGFKQHKLLIL